ncbi:BTB/POZ domain-containing protein 3-like isoform 1, partial [Aphelenchoides avenae]
YIYTDRAAVTVGNASGLLYLANKYLLSGLTDLVVGYMKTKIGKVNFSVIYREAVLHEEMRGVWADFIAQYPNDIFLSDDFVEVDFDEMRKVAVKSLAIDTLTFLPENAGIGAGGVPTTTVLYTQFSRSVDSSATNMRCVLADAFKLIRFVELRPEEFEQGPGCDELLTVHEKAVLRHWHEHGDFRSLTGPKSIATFHSLAAETDFLQGSEGLCIINARKFLMDGIADRFIAFEPREEFSLEFETDKRILFSGVACTFRSRELQAHRKYKLSVTANDAVGTQTQMVTVVVGRERGKPSGMTWRTQNRRSSEVHKSRLVYFTFTYGETRCVFAEILYRYVDDSIYGP